jgi:hypothetical protein
MLGYASFAEFFVIARSTKIVGKYTDLRLSDRLEQ